MPHTQAIQKLITWLAGLLIALLPILFGITHNLTQIEKAFIPTEYARFRQELLFFSISVTVITLFDLIELVADCHPHEQISKTLFIAATSIMILCLITSSISFGNYSTKAMHVSPDNSCTVHWFLMTITLISAVIKYIHASRQAGR